MTCVFPKMPCVGCETPIRLRSITGLCRACIAVRRAQFAGRWRQEASVLAAQGWTLAEISARVGRKQSSVAEALRGERKRHGNAGTSKEGWSSGTWRECQLRGVVCRNLSGIDGFTSALAEPVMLRQMREAGL